MIRIYKYHVNQKSEWDNFVKTSKNGTFLHLRDYMDYHQNRFNDFSLIACDDEKLVGLLPANISGTTLYTHQGLTYGGWIIKAKHFEAVHMLEIFDKMKEFLSAKGINKLVYKAIPHIYHSYPAEEDLYALFRNGATICSSLISSTVPVAEALRFNENARRGAAHAASLGVTVQEEEDFCGFWNVLSELLESRYHTAPVHSCEEISLLKSRFKDNIRLFTVRHEGKIAGGTVIFDTGIVAHAQYIATSDEGKQMKVLPLLFKHLIEEVYNDRKFFDFGTSNEDGGKYLNEGLLLQKAGMGGRGIIYNTYELNF